MSVVSGVISRQVLPACGTLCVFCPAMRARSRQPVKRYKKLIAEIFPRSQEEEPNDRKIGKLCEYAAKNPLRIPKITNSLEQRCYKELRTENFRSAKVVMCVYKKLLVSCKEQIYLIDDTDLEVELEHVPSISGVDACSLCILSNTDRCYPNAMMLSMTDGAYMFNLEGFIPKLCQLAQEAGEEEKANKLRSAGLQALSSLVWFMGQNSHISAEFDNVSSLNLFNLPFIEEDANNPSFWSRVCLHNMAKLAKEATTTRRVLESLFRCFDNGKLWPAHHGLAFPVLKDMQFLMDDSGENAHFLISSLIKHLDHKNVLKQPEMQLEIVEVTTSLTRQANVQPSVAIIGAITDVMRHLRKSIHYSLDDANSGADVIKWNRKFQEAVDECLVELSHKAFPEALFHQLLPAMVHPDHETRIGAHRIFSVVLVPSSVRPHISSSVTESKNVADFARTLSRTVSVFSSSAALFEKLRNEKSSSRENVTQENKQNLVTEGQQQNNNDGMLNRIKSAYSRGYSMKSSPVLPISDEGSMNNSNKELEAVSLRLSSRQISLLLSSIWAQSISPANMPENYEAIAHTYSLVLLFSRGKHSSQEALVRSFQLAFSLRSISLKQGGSLPPSRRRSLFTLATFLVIFSSKAYNILPPIPCVKASLRNKMVDPFLNLVDDCKLEANDTGSQHSSITFGSKEDDVSASKFISEIEITEDQSRESLASVIVKSLENSSNMSIIREQLLNDFVPDDVCPLGAQFMDLPRTVYQFDPNDNNSTEEASPFFSIDDDAPDTFGSQPKHNSEHALETFDLLSVNQLLESVLETAHQVGRLSVCTAPEVSYMEMAGHCEALLMGKQQKMSYLMSAQQRQGNFLSIVPQNHGEEKAFVDGDVQGVLSSFNTLQPSSLNMASKYYIIGSLLGSFAIAYLFDHYVADKKIFGGTTPRTVASKEWWEETDRKFDRGWPRTAGPPVVMNPISRQNFIVKESVES
ncbi:hypothetical protein RHMOL_Rhmol03G0016500 [Rhododendron molle]|uniref:Uncharacterized protein n=1 Tax=Rhododendron molle TaxID=49168 RepID=A0ACC0P999_RHOML|nr:hypothetical protein RHMOL_Rhmol03G0016500 [Rhododendron molle]